MFTTSRNFYSECTNNFYIQETMVGLGVKGFSLLVFMENKAINIYIFLFLKQHLCRHITAKDQKRSRDLLRNKAIWHPDNGRDHICTVCSPSGSVSSSEKIYFYCSISVRTYISHKEVACLYKSLFSRNGKSFHFARNRKAEATNWFVQHWRITLFYDNEGIV